MLMLIFWRHITLIPRFIVSLIVKLLLLTDHFLLNFAFLRVDDDYGGLSLSRFLPFEHALMRSIGEVNTIKHFLPLFHQLLVVILAFLIRHIFILLNLFFTLHLIALTILHY